MENKMLILLPYFNRPEMVKNALRSIRDDDYKNWFLVITDDGSEYQVEPSVKEIFGEEELNKTKIIKLNYNIEQKSVLGGSVFGKAMNEAIKNYESDIVIIICDDDALFPSYLTNLNEWFNNNPNEMWCYSHNVLYNPFFEAPFQFEDEKYLKFVKNSACGKIVLENFLAKGNLEEFYKLKYEDIDGERILYARTKHFWNEQTKPVNPYFKLDSTQIAWRTKCNIKDNIWFPFPQTANLDASIYTDMFNKYGECKFSGFYSEFKGMSDNNLCWRNYQGNYFDVLDVGDV